MPCLSTSKVIYEPSRAAILASRAVFFAVSSLIAFTRTGTKCSPLYLRCSSCSLSMITLLDPSNSRISWAINPYLCWPVFSSVSLDFLNQKLTGSNLFTKSKPCGTVPKSILSLLSEVAATSFFPAKPLGCYGDGGAVFTNDREIYEISNSSHIHGMGKKR